jgi:hypothetical protein
MKNLPRPDPRADTKEYRDFWLPRFEEAAKNPTVWASKSSDLRKAASLLLPDINAFFASVMRANEPIHLAGDGLASVFMMLMAFAAENLLKGILIARQPDLVTPKNVSKWEGGGHDLIELAKAAEIKLTEDETRLLLTLSLHGKWMGRYPCPFNHSDRLPRTTDGGGFGPPGLYAGSDLDHVFTLCDKFEQVLYAECKEKSEQRP